MKNFTAYRGDYRVPLILCYLEGSTRDEAAQQLGWSLSTLKRRLERGRELLRLRLGRAAGNYIAESPKIEWEDVQAMSAA